MSKCVNIRRKKREVCVGDLDNVITLQNRTLKALNTDTRPHEDFTGDNDVWALINTVRGKSIFDGANEEIDITHDIYIEFLDDVTTQIWILFEARRFDIIDVENLEERNEFLRLMCVERGSITVEASGA